MSMELHEEYFRRCRLGCPCVRYIDKSTLILRAKDVKNVEHPWLHIAIDTRPDGNHPNYYQFVVSASPVIYASPDFSHFSCHHTKQITDQRWEWDNYEGNLLAWVDQYKDNYTAIKSSEAVFVSWEMFCTSYDAWMANFLPDRILDCVCETFIRDTIEDRISAIKLVEDFVKDRFERVYVTWKNIKQTIENKHYADWLAEIINQQRS
jgi:hypothetical protein